MDNSGSPRGYLVSCSLSHRCDLKPYRPNFVCFVLGLWQRWYINLEIKEKSQGYSPFGWDRQGPCGRLDCFPSAFRWWKNNGFFGNDHFLLLIISLFLPTQLGTIHCEGAVFIMTSNLGSAEIRASSQMLHKLVRETKDRYLKGIGQFVETLYPTLKEKFKRDEFLGRINQTAIFLPFNNEEVSHGRYCNNEIYH